MGLIRPSISLRRASGHAVYARPHLGEFSRDIHTRRLELTQLSRLAMQRVQRVVPEAKQRRARRHTRRRAFRTDAGPNGVTQLRREHAPEARVRRKGRARGGIDYSEMTGFV